MARFLLTISILISIFTAGLGYFNKQKLDTARWNLIKTLADLHNSQEALAQIRKSGTAAQKQLSETTVKLEQISATLLVTQEELKKAAAHITDQGTQLAARDLQITALQDKATVQESKIKELTPTAAPHSSQTRREAEWNTQLAEQKALVTKLQSQLESAQNRIQEYVKKDIERQKLQTRLGLEGKILAVNQAWNFVVLSIGNKNGVTNNAEMLVKRGSLLVGKVRVTSVEPSSSIADIISSSLAKGQLVQPGDSVIYEMSNEE